LREPYHDLEGIQTIRHLVRAGRYKEAHVLLKQVNHPQVPALEAQISALLAAERPAPRRTPARSDLLLRGLTILIWLTVIILFLMLILR
jgi:hypothetical protein